MEVRLQHLVVFISWSILYIWANGSVRALPLTNSCLYGLLKTKLNPCHWYGRQRLQPCTILEERDLTTLLKSDAFRVKEVGGEYVPRSLRIEQIALGDIAFPTDTSLYFIKPTLAVSAPGGCGNGVASPHAADLCRVLYTDGRTFEAAKALCTAGGGQMMRIKNKWDQDNLPTITSEIWLGFEYFKQKWIWHGASKYWDGDDFSNAAEPADLTLGHNSVYMRRDGAWAFTNQSEALKPFVCERDEPAVGCSTGYTTAGEKCYKYIMKAMTLSSARQHCESEAAHIAHITNDAEQTAVYQVGLGHELWIGLHLKEVWKLRGDDTTDDAYRWHNGKVGHAPWVAGKPQPGDLCAALLPDGTWNSTPDCDELKGVICDIPKVSALQWGTWNTTSTSPWDAEANAGVILAGITTQQCPIKRFAFNTGKRSDCLQTHRGFRYLGDVAKNLDGEECGRWDALSPENRPPLQNMNTKTSLSDLQNYCAASTDRNQGPWCEAADPNIPAKACKIPTCPFVRETTCKTTLPGREYEGTLSKATNGATCDRWDTVDEVASLREFFPEKDLTLAENYCRNPTNDLFGPYCYVGGVKMTCNVSICEWKSGTTCRATQTGWDYMGPLDKTATGLACQDWSSYSYPDEAFPEKRKPHGVCRKPDRSHKGPWCHRAAGGVKEYCVVPLCDNVKQTTCKSSTRGWEYQGKLQVAHTGQDCMMWNATTHVNDIFADGISSDAVNYCRNPTKDLLGPYCMVDVDGTEVAIRCDIPICDETRRTTCRTTSRGWEYVGTQAVTASGHPCQRWDSQTPNTHTITPANGVPASWSPENYCRNIDNTFQGPWCYKADAVGWEACDIPICEGEY